MTKKKFHIPIKNSWLLVALLCSNYGFGQKINIGGGLGAMIYKGDYAPNFDPRQPQLGINAFVRYNINSAVSLKLGGLAGSVKAADNISADPYYLIRNQSFKSSISELSLISEYNFLNYSSKRKIINWTPYLFGGLTYYGFKPNARSGNYKLNQLALPFGAGIKYEFKRPWTIEFEYGTRKLFTDYLDNLGDNAPVGQKYRQGNPSTNDIYYNFSVSLSYTFYKIWCPED
jgi:Domain of unknown function (DUF6089)